MENKLTWVELKKVVARQTGLTEKDVHLLLSTWLDEMVAALKRGEELHINGLGTFRMKTMKARKSVNVTTGEEILLPETERLTYTMALGMENRLNDKGQPHMEAGIDPIQKLSDQADEIMDILGEMGQGPKADEQTQNPAEPEVPIVPEVTIPVTQHEQPKPQEAPKQEDKKEDKKKPDSHLWLTAGITILVFLLLVCGLIFFFQYKIEQWLNDLREQAEMVGEIPDDLGDSSAVPLYDETATDSLSTDTVPTDSIAIEQANQESVAETPVYTDFIGTEEMHQDSRLAWMAYRYYGKKDLWVFIYDANKDHISDPERIPVGTPIKIPRLDEETMRLSTPELQAKVKKMADEFLQK